MAKPAKRARDTYHVGNLAPQLLAAARALLEEVGPTKLSLRAVSERVGVSATAAYHHFQNRNELIVSLPRKASPSWLARYSAPTATAPGWTSCAPAASPTCTLRAAIRRSIS
ncbi:helix-turn-helix domain-containing protein [Halopseudomonas pachastrellae]|nr:helix-turn-helix domain-containing protein [Halopseudomonas pachastrellae]